MTGPHPSVAATRVAVRRTLREVRADADPGAGPPLVLVACSGGADSLALAAATGFEAPRAGLRAGAVVVDHQLQAGSEEVARAAADACADLGLEPVRVVRVEVSVDGAGPEAAARSARYAALHPVSDELGAAAVLLGHTRDDQAEQVLLGLARGSGARSLAGMPARRGTLHRPFLRDVDRALTQRACAEQRLTPWRDPHNEDERYTRVRARRLLTLLETELGPGVTAALARTADLLRADDEALTGYADAHLSARPELAGAPARGPWPVAELRQAPPAVRARLLRRLCHRAGIAPLTQAHVAAVEGLLARAGRGPAALPGGWMMIRRAGRLHLQAPGRVE